MTEQPHAEAATLVVGYTRDRASEHVLAVAADLGRRLRAQLRVVHVIEADDYPADPDSPDWEQQAQRTVREHRDHVARALAATDVPWDYEVRRGNPASELAQLAEEHDALLIIVGSRGEGFRTALSRLIEPSVSHGAIQIQHRPVLVVPPTKPDAASDSRTENRSDSPGLVDRAD
jgi:nucleotide-binding universal stress UspA family protein